MCAIAGQISFSQKINSKTTTQLLKKMVHRGPDDRGIFTSQKVVLGMNRLAIIDVVGGGQPLFSNDNKQIIIGNGEIYNHKTLRKKLKTPHTYKTKSDIEVALHAYMEFGNNFVRHLEGMFALAIYDEAKQVVVLSRDRLGEKPLYFSIIKEQVYFASELKAMITIPGIDKSLDLQQIHSYFHFQYLPEAKTPFKKIHKLPAGCQLIINLKNGSIQNKQYWHPSFIKSKIYSSPVSTFRKAIETSIEMTSAADVQVGISLSSGLDSATIAKLYADSHKNKTIAVTVGYQEHTNHDESEYAKKLTQAKNITHYIKKISTQQVVCDFPRIVYYADEPIADIASSAMFAVSKLAHQKGIKVLLTGLGSDELFWGYSWIRNQTTKNIKNKGKNTELFETTKTYVIAKNFLSRFFHLDFKNKTSASYIANICAFNQIGKTEVEIARASMNQVRDLWLTPNCVELADRLSMANSIELRSPFLNHSLFTTAYSSVRNTLGYKLPHKFWFKEAIRDLFDTTFLNRPKQGFTPPVKQWLFGIINAYQYLLSGGFLEKNHIFSPLFLKTLSLAGSKMIPFWQTIYTLLVLELWGRMYVLGEEMENIKAKA